MLGYLAFAKLLILIGNRMPAQPSRSDIAPLMGVLSHVRHGLVVLLVLTVGLLTWHHYGMERVVELTVANTVAETGADDEAGGASAATLTREGAVGHFQCHLVEKFNWPYCRLRLRLGDAPHGMDLRRFDRMSLDVSYDGSGKHSMRVELIDFEQGISNVADWQSNKVNEVDSFPIPAQGTVEIPLNLFYAAPWWKNAVKRPLAQTGVRLDNVLSIDLMTDSDNRTGEHRITLRTVRFHGKWISTTNLLVILVGLWMLAAIGWPALAALALRRQLNNSKAELALLGEVNKALQLEARELVGQAHTDPLTGVLNRQGLRAALISTSSMLADPMCVIFMDIDHFKQVNDTHGHHAGDEVLRRFAHVVGTNIRATDKLVRWGGEEFLLVCSNTALAQAAALAEKLRLALRQQAWPLELRVTASFGVAEHLPQEEFSDVIKRADDELYSAKQNGRDRVHADGLPKPACDNVHVLRR
jgi:diguanylate cyclase (GGDEF)-like protein